MRPSLPNFGGRRPERPAAVTIGTPAQDEEDSIAGVIAGVRDFVPPGTEVLVVDNGSSDGAALRAETAGVKVGKQLLRGRISRLPLRPGLR